MQIAFFTDTFLPQQNGIVTNVVDTAKKLADRGHKVFIVAPEFADAAPFNHTNVTLKRIISAPAFFYEGFKLSLPFSPSLFNFVIKNRVEVIHFHTPITLGMQAIIIAKLLNLPLVGTFHTFFAHPEYLKHIKLNHKIVENLAWRFSNSYYNRCDMVVCSSEATKSELIARKCTKPIRVIPLGIDFSAFRNDSASEIRSRYNKHGKLLLFVGRIAHEKNLPFLLECFARVLKKVPSVRLVIVGSGPQMPEVKAKVAALGITKSIIFTGVIPHEKLVKSGIFGACDVFVNASTTETGPLTVLEAQANGLVCVGLKGKGMDLIRSGVNGYVVDPHDKQAFANAVIRLLTDKSLYNKMRRATLKEAKKYELDNIIGMWEKTYKELCTGIVRHH